jgi:hypothetical protein
LIRKWMACFVVCGFLLGLGLCLIVDQDDNHQGSGTPLTLSQTAQACATSVVPCEDQSDSYRPLAASSLVPKQHAFYDGVSLPPPSPPPRG